MLSSSIKKAFTLLLLIGTISASVAQENYKTKHRISEYDGAKTHTVPHFTDKDYSFKKNPTNIILLIGDGMGLNQIYSAYTANNGYLNIFNMNQVGFSNTQSFSNYVTDSAAGATAFACGEKTQNGFVGLDAKGDTIRSLIYYAEKAKKSTGIIVTSAVTHATPAAFYAHVNKRDEYEKIAQDFLKSDIDLLIGGGESFFTERNDERNLLEELRLKGYTIEENITKINEDTSLPIGVLTAPKHTEKYALRGDLLPNATELGIKLLSKNKKGFFLMVEGSQIDWGCHMNDIGYVVDEVLDFDRAVGKALDFAKKDKNTLVIVMADHETGGLSIIDGNIQLGSITADFASGDHTGVMIPVFAYGCGAENFTGIYQNTEVFYKLMKLLKLKR